MYCMKYVPLTLNVMQSIKNVWKLHVEIDFQKILLEVENIVLLADTHIVDIQIFQSAGY